MRRVMSPAPQYQARRAQPGIIHIIVTYANQGVTRYACAIQLYGSAWSRAKRKGQGIGSVLAYLRERAEDKRQAVARNIIKPPASYDARMNQELSVKPEPKGPIMEIAVKTADLKKSLVAVCRSTECRSTIPILSHVKLEATSLGLRLTTTDLDVSRMELVPHAGGKPSAVRWTACVDAKRLKAMMPKSAKRAPTVEMSPHSEGMLAVCAGGGVSDMRTLPAEEFPMIPSMENASEPVVWSGEAFRDLAEKVFPAISTEESRFQLSGALFELNGSARAVATDGNRLHCVDGELLVGSTEDRPKDWSTLVPRELLKQARADYRFKPMGRGKKRYSNAVHLAWSENHVWLETYGVRYCARLIEGTFPDYERLFKADPPCRIETTGADLVSTIAAVEHCTGDRARAVRLELTGAIGHADRLPEFYAANPDQGEARAVLNGSTSISGQLENDPPRRPATPTGPDAQFTAEAREITYQESLKEFKASGSRAERQHIGLNPDYLSDIAKLFPGALDIGLWNENTQIGLTGPEFRAVIMPVRL